MIFNLRDKKGNTIVDIEFWQTEEDGVNLRTYVDIEEYSRLLLSNPDRYEDVIQDFNDLNNMREWFFEVYRMDNSDDFNFYEVVKIIEEWMRKVGNKYELTYVED